MKNFLYCLLLLTSTTFAQFSPESDPHRGVYVDKFFKTINGNNSLFDPAFSILGVDENRDGIYEKEDSLLRYAAENHITYLAIYDLYKIIGKNFLLWDEEKKQRVDAEEHLCRFIRKAKTQFGITQVGAIGGSESFFDTLSNYFDRFPVTNPYRISGKMKQSPYYNSSLDIVEKSISRNDPEFRKSEILKFCLRMMDFNAENHCQADFDVINVEYEFWADCANDFQNFVSILNSMYSLKMIYNSAHPNNPIITEVYVGGLANCIGNIGTQAVVQTMDGCTNCSPCPGCANPHPRLTDRILYAWFASDPGALALWEQNLFEDITTEDSTDFHPLLYSECFRTGGTADFIGTWFMNTPHNNIFTADEAYYNSWRNNSAVYFHQARQNNVQPGGSHWFSAMHMVGHLDKPAILQNTGPYCTADSQSQVTFNYYGPIENGIVYEFWITKKSDSSIVYPYAGGKISGISSEYQPAAFPLPMHKNIDFNDTLLFPVCILPQGEYEAHLLLKYENGKSYQCDNDVVIGTTPNIIVNGSKEFCEGDFTFLHSSSANTTWYRNGTLLSTGSDLIVMQDGDYSAQLNSPSTCIGYTDTVHIHVLPNPPIVVNAVCNGNGTATLKTNMQAAGISNNLYGATGALYRWNTGEITEQITVTPPTSRTAYRVNVSNPYSGCMRTAQITLASPLTQDYSANIYATHTPASSCSSDGILTAYISPSGTGPNSYLWSTGETTASIKNLSPGTYTVAMNVWALGCTAFDTIVLGVNPTTPPTVTPTIQNSSCIEKADGSISIAVSGGSSPFTYEWKNLPDDSIHNANQKDQSQLYSGNYKLRIVDANGCSFDYNFQIDPANPSPVIQSVTSLPVAGCPSDNSGSAEVIATGGTPPYTYHWFDAINQNTQIATNLISGSVKIEVSDINGCMAKDFAFIEAAENPIVISVLDSSILQTSCQGSNDGKIYLEINGGHSPFTVSSSWIADSNFAMLELVTAGIYPITIIDSMGCIVTDTIEITDPGNFSIYSIHHNANCTGCVDGSIELSFINGNPPYLISVQPVSGIVGTNRIDNLGAGIYTICASDNNGCTVCITDTILENPTGIFQDLISYQPIIFPNPVKSGSDLFINNRSESAEMKIMCSDGRLVLEKKINKEENIQLYKELFPAGIYFIRFLRSNGRISIAKLIVL